MLVLSYRESYSERHCNCCSPDEHSSSLQSIFANSNKEVVEFLANRIFEDEKAPYINVIFDDYDNLEDLSNVLNDSISSQPLEYIDEPIKSMVLERIETLRKVTQEFEEKQKQDALFKQLKEKEDRERAEFERLKNKYSTQSPLG